MKIGLYYDYKEETPLILTADAKDTDAICLIRYPHRAELYVNGKLTDEEWPCGNFLRMETEPADLPVEVIVRETEPEKVLPSVTSVFTGAEGWMPGNGVFVGDCMPYTDDGRYHVLYLYDRHHHRSKWGKGAHQWSHVSTADFETWQEHPMCVPVTEPWEGSICTGSFIKAGDKKYLYYTVRTMDGSPAPICRSVSDDGYHYKKDRDFSFVLSDRYTGDSARDPKVVCAEDGIFHMFVTSTERKSGCGVLVHLTSPDLSVWTEEEEPIYRAVNSDEPECSDYLINNGYYYLIFSLRGVGQYLYSQKPFTEWQIPEDPVIPCETVPKAASFDGKIIFAGFRRIDNYAGRLTFREAGTSENGEMRF